MVASAQLSLHYTIPYSNLSLLCRLFHLLFFHLNEHQEEAHS